MVKSKKGKVLAKPSKIVEKAAATKSPRNRKVNKRKTEMPAQENENLPSQESRQNSQETQKNWEKERHKLAIDRK